MNGTRSKQIRWYAALANLDDRQIRKAYNRLSKPERLRMIDEMGVKPKPPKQTKKH